MTFLNPLVLFGLAAAALPVIIHLLNLRRLRTVEFSSLQFLKELQRTKMRRLRIRQILLLALRVLIIAALVFAFSRPALPLSTSGFAGGTASTTMVLVIDDSPSMAVRNGQGVLFAQAKQRAAEILGMAQPGDRIYLLRLSEIRHTPRFVEEPSPIAAAEKLKAMEVAEETLPLRAAVHAAEAILAGSSAVNHELYLISDGQASAFAVGTASDSAQSVDPRLKVFLCTIPSAQPPNLAVVAADVRTTIVAVNKPVEVEASIANFAASGARNQTISVYLDGARVVQQSVSIAPFGTSSSHLTIIPKRRGPLPGYVQIDDDALEIDNRRFFVLDVPKAIAILLAGETAPDTKYPDLALTVPGDSSLSGLFNVKRIAASELASTDFNAFDVIILCNIRDLTSVASDRIAQFVMGGGGLMVFPGRAVDAARYNQTLIQSLGIPAIASDSAGSLGSKPPGVPRSFLSFQRIDEAHPIIEGLFERSFGAKGRLSIESPRVYSAITMKAAPKGHTIISLADGRPFLADYAAGRGRVLMFAVDAGLSESDFPLKGLFAPLLHRSMMYLASEHAGQSGFLAGDQIACSVKLQQPEETRTYLLKSPSGVAVRVAPRFLSFNGMANFSSDASGEVGTYTLMSAGEGSPSAGQTPLGCIAVNVDTAESDLRAATPEALALFFSRLEIAPDRVKEIPLSSSLETVIRQTRFGVELWRYFLIAALVLAFLEMAVAREARHHSDDDQSTP